MSIHVTWNPPASGSCPKCLNVNPGTVPDSFDVPHSADDVRVVVWGWGPETAILPDALNRAARDLLLGSEIDPLPQLSARIVDEDGGHLLFRVDALRTPPPMPGGAPRA